MADPASTPIDTPLARQLASHINQHGPLPVQDFMQACLHDPTHGYYRQRQPLGAAGDFITAPEISQMFGEIIGAWTGFVADALIQAVRPGARLNLIEMGPGRGVLMADVLRVVQRIPNLKDRLSIHFIEQNESLKPLQRDATAVSEITTEFHASLANVSKSPSIILANEFFDCLPIAQSVWIEGAWRARCVTMDENGLAFTTGPQATPELLSMPDDAPAEGDILEFCPRLAEAVNELAQHLKAAPGLALIIDYGTTTTAYGDSLQAIREHQRVSPLSAPGESDLTAHVNFAELAGLAQHAGLKVYGPMPQARFLTLLGLVQRLATLVANADATTRNALEIQAARLAAPGGMGDVFKAMVLASPQIGPPPPFTLENTP